MLKQNSFEFKLQILSNVAHVFEGPPKTQQILWPRHCGQETCGAELHKDLKVSRINKRNQMLTLNLKGTISFVDAYSYFT
jgi:nicotinamidase-related amidase